MSSLTTLNWQFPPNPLSDAEMMENFLHTKNRIRSFADVGCGSGEMLMGLAKFFPDRMFYGYDISPSIIEKNRQKAAGIENLSFQVAALPDLREVERTFDLVTCFRTLHYVTEVKRALTRLYELVNRNRFLVFNYPNYWYYLETRKSVHEYKYETEEQKRIWLKLYEPLLSKRNLLTQRRIQRILKRKLKVFKRAGRDNIFLLVKK